ncbi:MAG: HlyD family efflux transporter periplasmic adaptor subunit [Deltaproteobacteria bacterium]|jgi:HlyD family secretion protein
MKKFWMLLLIIALVGAAWLWGKDHIWAPNKAQVQYNLTKVERKDMVNTVSATGALSALVTVEVGTEVSGQIKELLVDYNTPVSAGQIIARIDPENYETLVRQAEAELAVAKAQLLSKRTEISRYEADLESAQANWSAAKAQAKKARVTLENARRNLESEKALVDKAIVSKYEYDKAQTAYQEAAAQLEQAEAEALASKSKVSSAKAALAIAKAQISEAEATVQLRIAAKDKRMVDLDNTIIRSPVDGVVIDRNVDVGQTVAASLSAPTLFIIAQDLSKMQVSTYVDEADIGRIKEGQAAQFTVDAFGTRQFNGVVQQVRKMGKTVQNVVTYEVIISADNRDMSLMPGMTADVQIELLKKPQVLVVANAALRFKPPDAEPNSSAPAQPAFAGGLPGAAGAGPPGGRPDPEARIKELTERLNLSESQQAELRKIFQQTGQKMRAAFQSGEGGGPGRMSALRDNIRKESQAAVTRMLDPQQRKLFEEMRAQVQPKRGTLWRLDARGEPELLHVVLGASDSSHTEISGPQITEGLEVISGITQ